MKPQDIKAARVRAGQTQNQAAESIGVASRTWQDWEGARARMPDGMFKLYKHIAGLERIPFRAVDYPRPEEA